MKQNLISTLTFKAIEAKARKAAAVAEIEARQQKTVKKAVRPQRPAIELDINSIFRVLKNNAAENDTVVLERPGGDFVFRAKISIYRAVEPDMPLKTPVVVYTFYANVLSPDRLGSVAIYGDDPKATLGRIMKSGHLFGHTVRRASVEVGRRPFVDVTLAS